MALSASFANILLLISCVLAGLVLLLAITYGYIFVCKHSKGWRGEAVHAMEASGNGGDAGGSGGCGGGRGGDNHSKPRHSRAFLTMKP